MSWKRSIPAVSDYQDISGYSVESAIRSAAWWQCDDRRRYRTIERDLRQLAGNRNTAEAFSDNIDFDVSPVIERGEPVNEAGERLFDFTREVASGALTTSEVLDVRETAISRFEPSM